MGSENLSHKFAVQDPTYKKYASSSKHEPDESSSHHSMCHTSGTHPVSMSNGPKSSASTSSTKLKHILKINPKYQKLFKLYNRQLSHIGTTITAMEALSKSTNNDQHEIISSYRNRVDELNKALENLRNTPHEQDHTKFDQMKNDIDQLINDLKSFKMTKDNSNCWNTVDYLVGFPLDVSDNENDGDETLIYL
jgi:hypothetical protein